jgi:hypothetical protein
MQTIEMRRQVLGEHPRGRVVMVDTIAHIHPDDAGHVVVCGSHGGISSGEYAARVPVAAVFFNDAGGGKENAGRASLSFLSQRGIAAGTVSHDTAMIGDGLETFESGVLSAVNECARAMGYSAGVLLREAIRKVLGEQPDAQ